MHKEYCNQNDGFCEYNANCPAGFVAMGTVLSTNSNADPDSFPEFRCLHHNLTAPSVKNDDYGIEDSEYYFFS